MRDSIITPAEIIIKVNNILTCDHAVYDGVMGVKMEKLVTMHDDVENARQRLAKNKGAKLSQMLFEKAVERFDTYAYELHDYLKNNCSYYK